MPSPLRPELYNRIKGRLGPVTIVNEGQAFQGHVTWNPVTQRKELHADWPGEYHATNCPYCNDTRQRLWINHRWSLYVKELKTDNLWLATCFNEGCLSVSGNAWRLKQYLFNDFLNGQQPDLLLPGAVLPDDAIRKAQLPGWVIRLDQLPEDHPACLYLCERRFNPAWLSQEFQVWYCQNSGFYHVQNRIIVPVYYQAELVGWQASFIGEPPSKDVPKYRTMHGMARWKLLYNFDVARTYPYVVVCEGATDVWRFGPEAVALFGKQVSLQQRQLLRSHWHNGIIIILLDADAQAEAGRIADSSELRDLAKVVVKLPEGKDPGDFSTLELRDIVVRAVREQRPHVGIRDVKLDPEMQLPS